MAKAGRTPNPDILCNKEIKFKSLPTCRRRFRRRLYRHRSLAVRRADVNGKSRLSAGSTVTKIRATSFYNTLGHEQIAQSLFPVGELEKPQVRKIAEDLGLATAKKDSTGIRFIYDAANSATLGRYSACAAGENYYR